VKEVIVERSAGWGEGPERIERVLQSYYRALGFRRFEKAGTGSFRLKRLWPLDLSPNTFPHTLEIAFQEGSDRCTLKAASRVLPWMRPKVRTISGIFLDRLARWIETSEEQRDGSAPPDLDLFHVLEIGSLPGLAWGLISLFLSLLFGVLTGMLVWWIYGYGLIADTVAGLAEKASLLTGNPILSIPTVDQLGSLTFGYKVGCAGFFGLTVGYMAGIVFAVLLLLGEVWRRFGIRSALLMVLFTLWLCLHAIQGESTLMGMVVTLCGPVLAYIFYTMFWAIRPAPLRRKVRHEKISALAALPFAWWHLIFLAALASEQSILAPIQGPVARALEWTAWPLLVLSDLTGLQASRICLLAFPVFLAPIIARWAIPRMARREKVAYRIANHYALGLGVALVFQVYVSVDQYFEAKGEGGADLMRFVEVRDRSLSQSAFGRWLSDFYYTHTLYPAEVIKPMVSKTQKLCVIVGGPTEAGKTAEEALRRYSCEVISVPGLREAGERCSEGGCDFLLIDAATPGLGRALGGEMETDLLRRVILYGPTGAADRLGPRARELPFAAYPIKRQELWKQVQEVSGRLDRKGALRRSINYSLRLILGTGWLFSRACGFFLVCLPLIVLGRIGSSIQSGAGREAREYRTRRNGLAVPALFTAGVLAGAGIWAWQATGKAAGDEQISEVRALGVPGVGDEGMKELCNSLLSTDSEIRYEAAYALWNAAGPKRKVPCMEAVLKGLDDEDPRVRMWCAAVVGKAGGPGDVVNLYPCLEDPKVNVRYGAARAIGRIGGAEAMPVLEARIVKGDTWYVIHDLWSALQQLRRRHGESGGG